MALVDRIVRNHRMAADLIGGLTKRRFTSPAFAVFCLRNDIEWRACAAHGLTRKKQLTPRAHFISVACMNTLAASQDPITRRRFLQMSLGAAAYGAVALGAASSLTACAGAAQQSQIARLGYFPNVTHAAALIGVQRGSFQEALGASVKLETKSFNAGPALIEAMLAGEIDLGYVGPNPAVNGHVRSRGQALRVIAGASSGGALFVVRPGANIKSPADLAGKKLATPQRGGTQDVALRHYVRSNGLKTADEGGDVAIVPTANQDILTLFQQSQIDGAWVPEPWGTRLLQEADGVVHIDERDLWPGGKFITTVVVTRAKFLADAPDVVRKLLQAHVDSIAFIGNQLDQAKVLANAEIERITSKALPVKTIDSAFTKVDFTYEPLAQTLVQQAQFAFDLRFLGANQPDLSGLFDLGLLNEVLLAKGLAKVSVDR